MNIEKKKRRNKSLFILFIISASIILVVSYSNVGKFLYSQEDSKFDGFKFSDYQKSADAEQALLKLHPIGSDTNAILDRFKTLVKSDKSYSTDSTKKQISFSYKQKQQQILNLVETVWLVRITDENGKIASLSVEMQLTGP